MDSTLSSLNSPLLAVPPESFPIATQTPQNLIAETMLKESSDRTIAILNVIPDLIARVSRGGVFLEIISTPEQTAMDSRMVGQHLAEQLPLEIACQCLQLIEQALQTREMQFCEYSLLEDGNPRYHEARIAACGVDEVLLIVRDTTECKQTEATLKRYQLLSQHTRDIVLFIRPTGQIVEANQAAVEAYGYSYQELVSLKFHALHDAVGAISLNQQLRQAIHSGLLFEATHYRKDNSPFPAEVSIQGATIDNESLLLSVIRDITSRKQAQERLFHSAFHDSLTGLPNRALFLERLRAALQKSQRQDHPFAVLFLDLDRFKIINDSLGHLVGDQLLVAIAQRLATCLTSQDTLARFGGDEFTILLESVQTLSEATRLAEQLQQQLAEPFYLNGQAVYTTTSIGIVLNTLDFAHAEDLLRSADTALYRAKALGGTRSVVFDAEMHNLALMRLRLETDLRRALAEPLGARSSLLPKAIASRFPEGAITSEQMHPSEFRVYYQPIVALKTRQVVGFEALVRWQHPERGLVSPAEFVPLAEETGLIVPLGWIVLQEACRQMQAWQMQFPQNPAITISVNLSVKQVAQPDLVTRIHNILRQTKLNPSSLKLEITESALMENAEVAVKRLHELRSLGVHLSLDDFGTGYSSLAYLHRFPIDTLKIDRSFISRVDTHGEQLEIVRTLVTLAWNLGIEVVAEGIETNKQLAQLKALRCEYGQGYLFSRPVTGEAATKLLAVR